MSDEEFLHIRNHRGTLALFGSAISEIVNRWEERFNDFERLQSSHADRHRRDGHEHHITVLTSHEIKQSETDVVILRQGLQDIMDSIELFDLGVGTVKSSFFVVIIAPKLQNYRKRFGFEPFDFHITLGFNGTDVHDERKHVMTLIRGDVSPLHYYTTAERLFRAPSSAQGRRFLHYVHIAQCVMNDGYLFGAYYFVQYSSWHKESDAHDVLLQFISSHGDGSLRLMSEGRDYGQLVCDILNRQVYSTTGAAASKHCKQRRFFSSSLSSSGQRYCITYAELPRNFSFVHERLAGASVPDSKAYMETLAAVGITDVVSLLESPLPIEYFRGLKLRYHFFAVDDRTPPSDEQMMKIVALYNAESDFDIDDHAEHGHMKRRDGKPVVLIHCKGGVGRTATALAAIMMWCSGMSPSDAKRPLMENRKTILSASQDAFLTQWYARCQRRVVATSMSVSPALMHHHHDRHHHHEPQPRVSLPPIIMCVGLPCSGKSTFSSTLCAAFPESVSRINQDEEGRRQCEELMGSLSKMERHCVILDRCNLSIEERREWLQLAHHKRAWALFFTASPEECKWRIVRRTGHPTVKSGGSGGARIIDSVTDRLQAPTMEEGFEQVIQVPSFDACNMLLREWGCSITPESTMPAEVGLLKFPRTRHIINLGAAARDDLVMTSGEVESMFLRRHVIVEEKIDGANLGFSIRDHQLCAQNRSHFVSSAYHPQFKLLDKWMAQHSNELWQILESEQFILYGEWMYAQHSIGYNRLVDWFVAFDIFDRYENKFLSRARVAERLSGTSIIMVPTIFEGVIGKAEELRALVQTTSSRFYSGPVEGVYVRTCTADWLLERGKIVRSDFMCGNEFWSKKGVVTNQLLHDA